MKPKRNPWEPKPWLDDHPWSLLKNIGLARKHARMILLAWLAAVGIVAILRQPFQWMYPVLGVVGALALRYILQRLQGVPAEFTGPSEAVTEHWPFQLRLAADVLVSILFGFISLVLLLGADTMRQFTP